MTTEFHDAAKAVIDTVVAMTLFAQEHGIHSPKLVKAAEDAHDRFVEVGVKTFYPELADK